MDTLYDRIGGTPAITVVVGRFLDRAQADSRLQAQLRTVNLNRQRMQQLRFLSYALGGTDNCPGGSPAAHFGPLMTDLGLQEEQLDLLLEHLQAAFNELGIPEPVVREATGVLTDMQNRFLGRTTT